MIPDVCRGEGFEMLSSGCSQKGVRKSRQVQRESKDGHTARSARYMGSQTHVGISGEGSLHPDPFATMSLNTFSFAIKSGVYAAFCRRRARA